MITIDVKVLLLMQILAVASVVVLVLLRLRQVVLRVVVVLLVRARPQALQVVHHRAHLARQVRQAPPAVHQVPAVLRALAVALLQVAHLALEGMLVKQMKIVV